MNRILLLAGALLLGVPASAHGQAAGQQDTAALLAQARQTDNAVAFASLVAQTVRRAHASPAGQEQAVTLLSEFASGTDPLRRAIAVDAVKSLPAAARERMAGVLSGLVEAGPTDGPTIRLYVRGLAEVGATGIATLRGMLNTQALTGDAAALARMYVRDGG